MSTRAVPRMRRAVGARLRSLRKAQRFSQAALGRRAGLSGKFIGEVERGEKSISLDSVSHVARALRVPAVALVPPERNGVNADAETVYALLASKPAAKTSRIVRVVRTMLA